MAPPNGPSAAGTVAALPVAEQILEPSPAAKLRRRVFGHAGITIGAGVLIVIIAVALLAPVLAPYDPLDQDLTQRVIPPVWHEKGAWDHPLGTDQFGRDPGLECCMPGLGDEAEFRFGPAPVQSPGGIHRTHDVIASLHDDTRQVSDQIDTLE